MKSIRHSVFETNSSSSHSLAISSKGLLSDLLKADVPGSGFITAKGGEFGWGVDTYYDSKTKFQYLITYLLENVETDEEIEKVKSGDHYKLLRKVVQHFCDIDIYLPDVDSLDRYNKFGYIDHQSYDVAEEAFESELMMANYLFNPSSSLIIDNDNR